MGCSSSIAKAAAGAIFGATPDDDTAAESPTAFIFAFLLSWFLANFSSNSSSAVFGAPALAFFARGATSTALLSFTLRTSKTLPPVGSEAGSMLGSRVIGPGVGAREAARDPTGPLAGATLGARLGGRAEVVLGERAGATCIIGGGG